MTILKWILLAVLALPAAADAQLRATDLENPDPVSVPEGLEASAVHDAIESALYRRDWTIHSEDAEQGIIIADLHIRDHWAQIEIVYGSDEVVIEYRDSDNLHYDQRDDGEIIHRNYLGWVDNLVTDIRQEMSRAAP